MPGARPPSRRPAPRTSRSCSPSAMPPVIGVMSWRMRASRILQTAALMNANFINIKVDREERPDVDRIYMDALHRLGEQGGWPLTMFLTPAGEPFWGGTYFPPESALWPAELPPCPERDQPHLDRRARQGHDQRHRLAPSPDQNDHRHSPTPNSILAFLAAAANALLGAVDFTHGGSQGAPKFPQAPVFDFPPCAIPPHRRSAASRSASPPRSPPSPKAASTIIWAAALPAIRSTAIGSSRISRRCSTTMPSISRLLARGSIS